MMMTMMGCFKEVTVILDVWLYWGCALRFEVYFAIYANRYACVNEMCRVEKLVDKIVEFSAGITYTYIDGVGKEVVIREIIGISMWELSRIRARVYIYIYMYLLCIIHRISDDQGYIFYVTINDKSVYIDTCICAEVKCVSIFETSCIRHQLYFVIN